MTGNETKWTAAITEDGDIQAAFVEGHVPLDSMPDAEGHILASFKEFGAEVTDIVSEAMDGEPVHKMMEHFWVRKVDGRHSITTKDDAGARPVTGVRFLGEPLYVSPSLVNHTFFTRPTSGIREAAQSFMSLFVPDTDPPCLSVDGIDPNELAHRYEALSDALSSVLPPPRDGVGVKRAEVLATIREWQEWATKWAGSAFIADEKLVSNAMSEEECKAEIYQDLCKLMNHLSWLHDEVSALTAVPADEDAAKAGAVPVAGEPVAMGVFRDGRMIGFVGLGEEFRLSRDTDERRPVYASPIPAADPIAKWRHECARSNFHDHDGCSCPDDELRRRFGFPAAVERGTDEAFLRLCEELGISATAAAYLDARALLAQLRSEASPAPSIDGETEAAKALEKAWTDFLDINPDSLTSPEDLPNHALMTGEQFVQYALAALDRLSSHPQTDEAPTPINEAHASEA